MTVFSDELVSIHQGDCLEVLRTLAADSVDAIVTDPPAGIGFMGKEWDDFRRARNPNDTGRDNVFGRTSAKGPEYGRKGGRGSWEYPIAKHGFSDGGDRLPAPTIGGNSANPMCRRCHQHKRGWKDVPGCRCQEPDFDTQDRHLAARELFIDFMTAVMVECRRVLKPGGHALVWAIPRTSHWTATAIEDAGFEIRDVVTHHFGSGFPKSLDVSKAIDKAAGLERKVVGKRNDGRYASGFSEDAKRATGSAWKENQGFTGEMGLITEPASEEAAEWQGWGTALKPASEHWILARRQLGEANVAANVLKYGTGAINIDGCRIHTEGSEAKVYTVKRLKPGATLEKTGGSWRPSDGSDLPWSAGREYQGETTAGRWPANLVLSHSPDCRQVETRKVETGTAVRHNIGHSAKGNIPFATGTKDENMRDDVTFAGVDGTETVTAFECVEGCPVAELDRQSGVLKSGMMVAGQQRRESRGLGGYHDGMPDEATATDTYGDLGGASRFFYTAKASGSERNAGLEGLPERTLRADDGNPGHLDSLEASGPRVARNHHPTVKPVELMRWLCRLICPPGGIVLDPFLGSGTTLVAAKLEGFRGIGIEREADYIEIAKRRLGWAHHQPTLFQ